MMNTSARHRISGTLRQWILNFDSLKALSGLTPYLDRLIHGHHVSAGRISSHGHFWRDDLLACWAVPPFGHATGKRMRASFPAGKIAWRMASTAHGESRALPECWGSSALSKLRGPMPSGIE